jgi:repressor LexA
MDKPQIKIGQFYHKHHRMPSYAEVTRLLGYKSKSAAAYVVRQLLEAGVIERDKTGRLLPGRLVGETRLLGLVEAGFPSPAEEELIDTINFDEYLTPNKESTYILKVKGESMIDAGIHEGDMVVVERRQTYKPGQIVIATVDGEYTMKYLRRSTALTMNKEPIYYLEPANAKFKNIYPKERLTIEAVVTGVVRKY